MNPGDTAQLIRAVQSDIICGDDGFFVWWPNGAGGALSSWMLRALADELDHRNAPWAAQIEEALSPPEQCT